MKYTLEKFEQLEKNYKRLDEEENLRRHECRKAFDELYQYGIKLITEYNLLRDVNWNFNNSDKELIGSLVSPILQKIVHTDYFIEEYGISLYYVKSDNVIKISAFDLTVMSKFIKKTKIKVSKKSINALSQEYSAKLKQLESLK